MAALIQSLIQKVDTFEVVRDQIAGILDIESRAQQALAQTAAKDPALWKLRVFTEATNPWEMFREPAGEERGRAELAPVVNVFFDRSTYDPERSDVIKRQTAVSLYNIDCLGYGISTGSESGHTPGDMAAALESQRAARLVRNILMSSYYTNLGMLKTVGQRFPVSLQALEWPDELRARFALSNVRVTRFVLAVTFTETSPQYEPQPLETVGFTVKRSPDGRVLANVAFDLTTP